MVGVVDVQEGGEQSRMRGSSEGCAQVGGFVDFGSSSGGGYETSVEVNVFGDVEVIVVLGREGERCFDVEFQRE